METANCQQTRPASGLSCRGQAKPAFLSNGAVNPAMGFFGFFFQAFRNVRMPPEPPAGDSHPLMGFVASRIRNVRASPSTSSSEFVDVFDLEATIPAVAGPSAYSAPRA